RTPLASKAVCPIHAEPIQSDIVDALSDPSIDALKCVRNLLVHRAGIADEEYEGAAYGTTAPQLKTGQRLELDASATGKDREYSDSNRPLNLRWLAGYPALSSVIVPN